MEYFVIKTSSGENCTVGCVDEAGRGVEVYSGCTDHVLKKKKWGSTNILNILVTTPNVRVADCCFSFIMWLFD
jgi:hypothetical protein